MKVILTGYTTDTANGRSQVGFESMSLGLERMCKALSHEVRMKPMYVETNEEDLTWADVMVVGLGPINAVGSRFCLGALDAIAKARRHNCGLVFYVTDWQTHLLGSAHRSILKNTFNLTKWHLRNRTDFLWGVHNNDYLISIIDSFERRPWPVTLVPVHTWFDPSTERGAKLVSHLPSRELVYMDPTAFTTGTWEVPCLSPEDKSREYTLAALGDYSKWMNKQGFTWPVRYFGGRTHVHDGEGGVTRNERVKEKEVNDNYAQTWVGISPKHSLSGSGWWRTRYDFTLRAGSLLYGESMETYPMGDAFRLTVEEIESASTAQLAEWSKAQREQFQAKIEPAESVLTSLESALIRGRTDLGLS